MIVPISIRQGGEDITIGSASVELDEDKNVLVNLYLKPEYVLSDDAKSSLRSQLAKLVKK